ncbi:acyl-CoA dehydrogenase [Pseudooceanicola sp.]|uniref:acyl-CoA dehydrogenase n=1 Tax=Pseudooceanicola sp. TaxID=1914328 RepID=UPI00262EBA30|nr:acyl-CoA dehydrogenase [Pseudooceanicola sp.]MDF1857046.1 acyl-CoA dehydrogenase [Pseudooceanicola sp.]
MSDTSDERAQNIRMIRDSAAAITGAPGDLRRIRELRFTEAGMESEIWQRMADLGWVGLLAGEDAGGIGLGMAEFIALSEELGRALVPEPLIAAAAIAPDLPASLLCDVVAGELVILPIWRDMVGTIRTVEDNGKITVTGSAARVPCAPGAHGFAIQTDSGCHFIKAQDCTITSTDTLDGGTFSRVTFDAAPAVPIGDLSMAYERATLASAAYLLGAAERAFEITLDYIKLRHQFGRAIGSFQALQHRAVDMKLLLEVTRAVLADCVAGFEVAGAADERKRMASRAKSRASDTAMRIARDSTQMHGAIGITDAHDIGLYTRKIATLFNQYGTAKAHRRRYLDLTLVEEPCCPNRSHEDKNSAMNTFAPSGADRDYNAMTDASFRAEVRDWVQKTYPEDMRFPLHRLHRKDTKVWYDLLAEKGWLAPNWPREHGGMGLGPSKRVIFIEELERHGCSRVNDQGVLMIGPLLIDYGTQAQRDYFLPKIHTGEHIWAQGYSEPDAGSDLASLRTEAVRDGDEWVINGQKIWTSLGNDANWIYLLARTDKDAKKQEGISFFLVPADAPGVDVRPILTLNRSDEFCEVFFDDVRIPLDALVGELNAGWTMAKALLGFERIFVGSPAQSSLAFSRLEIVARETGLWDDPSFRDRYAVLALDLADHVSLYASFVDKLKSGEKIGPDVSMLKIFQTELYQRIAMEAMEVVGDAAAYVEPLESEVNTSGLWLHTLQTTIYGGTSEVQRGIIAKNVLGL